jgi:uncharacterized protein (DUF952 family)
VLVYHVATAADWARARRDGVHTTSTRGRTLEQEGFIHASRADQWRGVHARFYADVGEPLVLLEIDTDRLGCPVVEEPGEPGGTETFPHIQGPVPVTAVLRAVPVEEALAATSFSSLFLREVLRNAALGFGLIVLSAIGAVAVGGVDGGSETLVGAAAGLAVGLLLMWLVLRRGRPRT